MERPIRIAITSGDVDGIGLEVVSKALNSVGPVKGIVFYLWRSPNAPKKLLDRIDRSFKRITVHSWPAALEYTPSNVKELVDISSNLSPASWVETSAQASFFGHIDALATGPLSKTTIQAAGMNDIGHTDILKRVSKSPDLFMAFLGEKFHVLLATGHIPISRVQGELSARGVLKALEAAQELKSLLPKAKAKLPIGLLGLNPHAGEKGLIGREEIEILEPALKLAEKKGILVKGPLVPDATFDRSNWERFSVFVATYHDQGLIPFKSFHGHRNGVHVTMGLPFVRTSVDHGTAKEIFGKNKADASSMKQALEWAVRLARQKATTKERSP